MKAVILAAGKGVRLMPLTENIPKVLVEVAGKPFLYYLIENVKKAGYDEIALIVNYKKERIADFLEEYDIDAVMIEQKEPKGTADAIKCAEDFVNDENFVCIYGDNLFSSDDLKKMDVDDTLSYIAGIKVENPERYGVLITDDEGFLTGMPEKPKEFLGNFVNSGVYKFTSEIFDAIDNVEISPRGEYEINDAIMILAREKKVKTVNLSDHWLDLGNKEDIPRIEEFIKGVWNKSQYL